MPDGTVFIVAALVRRAERLLLVEQQAPHDAHSSWMLPGGRVEAGETLSCAVARELAEESGLRLERCTRIAFAVDVHGVDGSYSAITFDVEADGELRPDDPDGFVRAADWVPVEQALERLRCVGWYDCEPLARYLNGDAPAGAVYVALER